jgi:hypothetical protein
MVVHPVDELQFKVESFLNSRPWKRLRPQQQNWVLEFIATDDARIATRRAYPAAAETSIVPMTHEIGRSPRIRAALELWRTTANDVQMIQIVRAQLKAAKPGSRAAATFSNQLQRLLLAELPEEIAV